MYSTAEVVMGEAEVVIGDREACENLDVVIDRANGVDRHFWWSISTAYKF